MAELHLQRDQLIKELSRRLLATILDTDRKLSLFSNVQSVRNVGFRSLTRFVIIVRSLHAAAHTVYTRFRNKFRLKHVIPGTLSLEPQSWPSILSRTGTRTERPANTLTLPSVHSAMAQSEGHSSRSHNSSIADATGRAGRLCIAPSLQKRKAFVETLIAALDYYMGQWENDFTLTSNWPDKSTSEGRRNAGDRSESDLEYRIEPWKVESRLVFDITYQPGRQMPEGGREPGMISMNLADAHFHGKHERDNGRDFHFCEETWQFPLFVAGTRVPHGVGICGGLDWIPEGRYALTPIYDRVACLPRKVKVKGQTHISPEPNMCIYLQYCQFLMLKRGGGSDESVYRVTCFPARQANRPPPGDRRAYRRSTARSTNVRDSLESIDKGIR